MRLFTLLLVVLFASGNVLGLFAQGAPVQSGFAIMTLVSGNIGGLIASENLKTVTTSGLNQTIVGPSPLVTTASLLVPVGPTSDNTTGLAITNPSSGAGAVNLILTDASGNTVLNSVVVLGAHGHFSGFLNELFSVQPDGFSTPLLLTVSSEIPVAILALNFRNQDFASIPLTSLSSPTPVPVQPVIQTPSSSSATLGFGIGLPPSPAPTQTPGPVTATTSPTTAASIGGSGSLVFAQVVSGSGWSTEIAVGNTSAGTQVIQIDVFGSDGVHTRTVSDIAIPPRGVFFFSIGPQVRPLS